jgi:RNA polymerase sigma-70 factor (ECF subfamily)
MLEELRRHAFGVAYRMLGSVADAEDVVQEALLRLTRADAPPDEPVAWMTTVTTRLAIDHLRLARVRRETYVGPWLPDPLIADAAPDPGARVELTESLSQAFLVVLERLTPVERAAFLLRDVFEYDYAAIGEIVGKSEANARQVVTRARKRLDGERPRFDADAEQRQALLERFLAAAEDGDLDALERLLADDAVLYSDGGGKALAALLPIYGAAKVARFMAGTTRLRRPHGPFAVELVHVNGQPGRVLRDPEGAIWDVLSVDVADGRIQAVRIVRNPDKLGHVTGGRAAPSEET